MAGSNRSPKARSPVTAVAVAALDSGGGAGIAADILTFAAHSVHPAIVLTAATAQNTRGITAIAPMSPRFIAQQMDAVFSDFAPRAVKIGMLFDGARARAVARGLARHRAGRVVLDPVIASTSGTRLLSPSGLRAVQRELFPLCDLVTPNLPEAERLAGIRIRTDADRWLAAGLIADMGARAVLITGGHSRGRTVRDFLFDGQTLTVFDAPRISTRATHGTGCVLSSAIAANLALGHGLQDAVLNAIAHVRAALLRGVFPGRGAGVPGRG
jgi:hydroxymethylpyrimidine/phosphomethylpyrimidine kinase